MASDYYELLGVQRTADAAEIKRAFRRKARELHPDVNPDDAVAEERFREVTAAYEVLSDDERRSIYDRFGEDGLKQRHWEPQAANFGNIADIFSAFFGGDDLFGQAAQRGPARGDDALIEVELSFRDAALGVQRELEYAAVGACATCDGRGAASEDGLQPCAQCAGQGVVRTVARSIFGQVVQETTCPRCGGRGEIVIDPCATCHGTGEQAETRQITVDIPAGIANGQRIRLTGRGSASATGGPPGNLYVDVHVTDDERWVREGDDLVGSVDLTLAQAALGCELDVPTVDGDNEAVVFDPGTQTGQIATLRGRGVGRIRSQGRGDMRLVVNVQVPRDLTSEQRELMRRFQELETDRNYRSDERLMDKLRRVFRG